MKSWLHGIGHWFESRLQLGQTLWPVLRHPVPRGLGWWYVFGSATLTCFVIQVITGLLLAMVYVPAADKAYDSLEYLNYQQTLGWYLRALHYWSATGMVVMVSLHMTRVFLMAAFKYPRELTWLTGVLLFFLTLGLGFSGQVLRWDQDAYWGVGVGAAMTGRVPLAGPALVRLILGGATIGGPTLSRFFSLHVFILPGLLILFLSVHLYLVVKLGISARPVPGQKDEPGTYEKEYQKKLERGEPFYPVSFLRDLIFSSVVILVLLLVALVVGPRGPTGPPDPTLIHAEPRPDWYFWSVFALLALSPAALETALMLGLPLVLVVVLVLVPFLAGRGERSPRRRPLAVLAVLLIFLGLITLAWLGYRAPWSPKMTAWSGDPIPPDLLQDRSPRELQGAAVFQNKSCRNCHALEGSGGQRGPDLTSVATRLDHEELIRQVIQGGGNMPAYGDRLEPAQVEALVAFLETLHPRGEQPARAPLPEQATR